jgi:NAD(P)-dependent dehydrogenase (short-subunit alcohol dehydrogenase family)
LLEPEAPIPRAITSPTASTQSDVPVPSEAIVAGSPPFAVIEPLAPSDPPVAALLEIPTGAVDVEPPPDALTVAFAPAEPAEAFAPPLIAALDGVTPPELVMVAVPPAPVKPCPLTEMAAGGKPIDTLPEEPSGASGTKLPCAPMLAEPAPNAGKPAFIPGMPSAPPEKAVFDVNDPALEAAIGKALPENEPPLDIPVASPSDGSPPLALPIPLPVMFTPIPGICARAGAAHRKATPAARMSARASPPPPRSRPFASRAIMTSSLLGQRFAGFCTSLLRAPGTGAYRPAELERPAKRGIYSWRRSWPLELMMRLTNHVALVTGAGRGIGRAIAVGFAEEGASVAVLARSSDALDDVVATIESLGGRAIATVADVTDEASVASAVGRTIEELGPIDVLVNCAGIYRVARFWEQSLREWKQIFDVNVHGAFIVTKAVVPGMIERRSGRVVNLASTAAKWGTAQQAAYNASKHALLGMMRCLALETAQFGIRVNAICPSYVDSPMVDEQFPALARLRGMTEDSLRASLDAGTPIGRLVRVEEILPLAVYLASPESDGMTGQALTLDGGRLFI